MSDTRARDGEGVISRYQILSLYIPALILALGTGVIAPVLPVYAKSFNISFGIASLIIVAYQLGSLAATLPAGYLMDKIGRRPIILAGPVALGLSSILTALAGTFPELVLFRFIGGVANQLWMQARLAVIADTARTNNLARQVTWMIGMQRAGMMLGPAVGGLLAAGFDIRLPFIVHGLLCFLAVAPSFKIVKETAPEVSEAPERSPQVEGAPPPAGAFRTLMTAIFTVQMVAFLVIQFFATVCRGGEAGTFNLYAVYAYGIGPKVLGFMNAAVGVLVLPIPFLTGYFMDRYGRKVIVVPGFALYGLAILTMGLSAFFLLPFEAFVVTFLLVQATLSTTNGTMQTLGADVAPVASRGMFFGIWRFIAQVGSLIGPALFAVLADQVNYGTAFLSSALAAFAVSILVAFVLKETLKRDATPVAA